MSGGVEIFLMSWLRFVDLLQIWLEDPRKF